MADNMTYLFAAFLISWFVIGAYLWSLGRQVQSLREEVEILTEENQSHTVEGSGTPSAAQAEHDQPEQRAAMH